MMGFPRIITGRLASDPFTFVAPDPIGGAELVHVLTFRNSGRQAVWQLRSESTTIVAPDLPTGYDPTVTYPFPGAAGLALVQSKTRLAEGETPGADRDYFESVSEAVSIVF